MVPDIPGMLGSGRLDCIPPLFPPAPTPTPEDDYSQRKHQGLVELLPVDLGIYCHYLIKLGFR